MISRAQDNPEKNNADRLRMAAILALATKEKTRRATAKEQGIERNVKGRGR